MNARTTKWLMLAACLLFGYIYLFERATPPPTSHGSAASPLLSRFRPDAVATIEVLRSNMVIRAERTKTGWRLTAPAYPAQRTVLNSLLDTIAALSRRQHIAAREILAQGGLPTFGLEPPTATLVLHREGGSIQMRLGGRAPAGHQFYLQVVGEDGVYVVDDRLLDRLPSTANDWRDPQLFSLEGAAWNRLEIRAGQRDLRVERDPVTAQWRMLRPLPARADGMLIERLVTELQSTRVSRFVADQAGADLEPYGLQNPEFIFTLGQGTNQLLTLSFGKSPTNDASQVYALRSAQTNIVLVPRAQLDLLRVPPTSFLERRLANVPADAVDRLEIRTTESFAVQRQTNGTWQVQRGAEAFEADRESVAELLRDLAGLEAAEIAKDVVTELDLPSYGLAPPLRSYALRSAPNAASGNTNTLLAQVEFGTIQTNRVFARRSDESTVYLVNNAAAARLAPTALALRNRQIWSFTTNQVSGVLLRSGGQSRKLARSPRHEWSVPGGGPVTVPLALDELLFRLGELKAITWTARKPESLAPFGVRDGEQEITVELRNGDTDLSLQLQFGGFSPGQNPYLTTVLGEDRYVCEVSLTVYAPFLEVLRDLKMPAPSGP